MKQTIRLTENELRNIISESVRMVLNEMDESKIGDFFNGFRRSVPVRKAYPNNNYVYDPDTQTYWYKDENGKRYNTEVGYEKGRVGMNRNPFKSTEANQVSPKDFKNASNALNAWHNKNARNINQSVKDTEERNKEFDSWFDKFNSQQNAHYEDYNKSLDKL